MPVLLVAAGWPGSLHRAGDQQDDIENDTGGQDGAQDHHEVCPVLRGNVLPVLLLGGLGALFLRTDFLSAGAIDGLRKLVLNVTLPAALFRCSSRSPSSATTTGS